MKKIVAILFISFMIFQIFNFQYVIEVKTQKEPTEEYMPPYLQTNILVNISIEAFDSGLIGTGQNLSISSIQEDSDNMRVRISSMLQLEDFERGWTYFEVSLSAYKQQAQIKPMLVERVETITPDNPNGRIFYKVSSQYDYSIDSFVLYPSSLNENKTRDSTALIGWETSEEKKGISHDSILKSLNLERSTMDLKVSKLYELPFSQTRNIKGLKVVAPISTPKDNEKLDFQQFTVSNDMSNTVFQWVMNSFGFDIGNSVEKNYVKGFYASSFDIEKYIPFEYTTGDFFHDFITNLAVNAVTDVVIKPVASFADDFGKDPLGATVSAIATPITSQVNSYLKLMGDCVQSFPPCVNVISGVAVDLATQALGLPTASYVGQQSEIALPAPQVYPESSEIPPDTNTNIRTSPLKMLSSLIPPGTSTTTLIIGGVVIVGGIGVVVLLLMRSGGSSSSRSGSSSKSSKK